MSVYILPVILVALLVYSLIKRVKIYDCFLDGGKESLALVKTIFPYIAAVFVAIELFRASGLSEIVSGWPAAPPSSIGIPPGLSGLVLPGPPAGTGAIALLE